MTCRMTTLFITGLNQSFNAGGSMTDTPRTDAIEKANEDLRCGSIVHDPWELSRTLEKDCRELRGQLENCVCHLQGVARRWPSEYERHAGCLEQANNVLSKTGLKYGI